ncbi:FAD:protein FMN transferase [Eremococcus coleocola]|uniref:FAD:protein FMN transferase n=1 Tax=Eremococcus coleocola TaxID=88132 RepID=UPI00041CF148|nr:FAD:protein FMN transferase [Eremococcus coleocola]
MRKQIALLSVLTLLTPLAMQPVKAEESNAEVTTGASPKTENQEALEIVKDPETRTETLLHTAVQLSIYHKGQEAAMDEAFDYMRRMEKLLSTNLEGSDIYKINQAAGKEAVKVQPETFELMEKALEIAKLSDGAFDVTIGAVTNLWRIGDVDEERLPSPEEIEAALPKIDYHKITLNKKAQTIKLEEEGMVLEMGGISKGYIGSGVKKIFQKYGITTALINLGGNVIVMGTSPSNDQGWNVGVQDPDKVRGTVVGARRMKDYAIITSGIYERYLEVDGKKYHHILDPKTGYPLENNISGVTVFAPESVDGDGYSTSLFLMGIDKGLDFVNHLDGVEAVFIDKDHGLHLSEGLKDSFELTNEEYHIVK